MSDDDLAKKIAAETVKAQAAEKAKRNQQGCIGCLGIFMLALAIALSYALLTPTSPPATQAAADGASPAEPALQEPPARVLVSDKVFRSPPLPKGVESAPVVVKCTAATEDELAVCESDLKQMVERDWPGAWRGDYQGARNVGFCLRNGCAGSTVKDLISSCAWRLVMIGSGDPQVNDLDARNVEIDCGKLTSAEKAAAYGKAKVIFRRVHGRELD